MRHLGRTPWRAGVIVVSMGALAAASSAQMIRIENGQKIVIEAGDAKTAPVERIDDPAQLKRAFEQLVADLSGNDFAARQRASEKLNANEQFDLAMLETALKRVDLTLEARSRLVAIARQRFFRTPRAALGFQFGGQLRDRIVVGQTFPRFASFKLLQEGDMIVGADGFKLDGPGARFLLQSIIISHDPDEILKLVVRRGAQKLELDVPLGRFADLDQQGALLMEDRLSRAWRIRAQSRLNAISEPIRAEPSPATWGLPDDSLQRRADRILQRDANDGTIKLVGGGMPRLARGADEARFFEPAGRQQVMIVNGQARVLPVPFMRGGFGGEADPDSGLPPLDPKVEIAQLLEARMGFDKQLGGQDPDSTPLDEPRRRELGEFKKKRDLITKQMDALQAEMEEVKATARDSKRSAVEANAPPPAP